MIYVVKTCVPEMYFSSIFYSVKCDYVVGEYYLTHSEPQRIEDTFALAMTYNSEPKEASVAKIRKYIKDFYKEDISIEK